MSATDPVGQRPVAGAGRAYLLLLLCMLFWAGNAIAARLAVGEISPMVLNLLRWAVVVAVLGAVPGLAAEAWALFRAAPMRIVLMGGGLAIFNSAFYLAAHHTSAVNITIIQGSIPALVLVGALIFHRSPMHGAAAAGAAVTLMGVGLVASGGSVETLFALRFNSGDLLMIAVCVCYAGYTLGVRGRPAGSDLGFFTALAAVALMTGFPLLVFEAATSKVVWPGLSGWALVAFVGIFPSLLSQVFYIRGVEAIGAARGGLFVNLVPVFGPLLAVLVLGESFGLHHALGLLLVVAGIGIAESRRRPVA